MRGEPWHASDPGTRLADDASPDVVVIGADDDITTAYVREKLYHVARATGRPIRQAEVLIAPIDADGGVLVDLTIQVGNRTVRSQVVAASAMSALDRFESQLRRQLASDDDTQSTVLTV